MKYLMLCLICIIACNTTIFSQDKFGDKNEICSICGEDDRTPFSASSSWANKCQWNRLDCSKL